LSFIRPKSSCVAVSESIEGNRAAAGRSWRAEGASDTPLSLKSKK
jgi:hypothetical protein